MNESSKEHEKIDNLSANFVNNTENPLATTSRDGAQTKYDFDIDEKAASSSSAVPSVKLINEQKVGIQNKQNQNSSDEEDLHQQQTQQVTKEKIQRYRKNSNFRHEIDDDGSLDSTDIAEDQRLR